MPREILEYKDSRVLQVFRVKLDYREKGVYREYREKQERKENKEKEVFREYREKQERKVNKEKEVKRVVEERTVILVLKVSREKEE